MIGNGGQLVQHLADIIVPQFLVQKPNGQTKEKDTDKWRYLL